MKMIWFLLLAGVALSGCQGIKQRLHEATAPDQTTSDPQKKPGRKSTSEKSPKNSEKKGTSLSDRFTKGNAQVRKLSPGTFAIVAESTFFTSDATMMYQVWEDAAKKACPRGYRVVDRQSVHRPGHDPKLEGTIECK